MHKIGIIYARLNYYIKELIYNIEGRREKGMLNIYIYYFIKLYGS